VLFVLAVLASAGSVPAATSSTVVGVTIPSATSLGPGGCAPGVAGKTEFGSVLPGSTSLTTSDCTVTFGSSNDTAALRMAQLDASGMALAGAPDRRQSSWGASGVSVFGVASFGSLGATSTAVQPDGKTVAVGCAFNGAYTSAVYRLNADGTLDTAGFNAPNGYILLDIAPGANDCFNDLALQADGKIVAVGYSRTGGTNYDGTIARVNTNGTADTAFGGGGTGWRVDDLGGTGGGEQYRGVVVNADGTIVAGGNDDVAGIDDRWVFSQFLTNGTPDPAIGAGSGRTTINPTVNQDQLFSLAADPRGGFVAGGQAQPASLLGEVARVTPALTLDTTWGASGYRQIDIVSYYETVTEIKPQADGSDLLTIAHAGGAPDYAIVGKLTPSGALDTAGFNSPNGWIAMPSSGSIDTARSIEVTSTGSIYVLWDEATNGTRITRLTPAGVYDTTFGTGGSSTADPARNSVMHSLHLIGSTLQFTATNSAAVNDWTVRYGGPEVDDYLNLGGGTDRDWNSGNGTNVFGVCLRDLTGSTGDWTVDANTDCTAADTDPWRSIPTLTSNPLAKVAHTTSATATSTAYFRFGFRPATNLAPGRYEAPILLEVVAPG
jgi:uncharacterized delta-60 repeat protein